MQCRTHTNCEAGQNLTANHCDIIQIVCVQEFFFTSNMSYFNSIQFIDQICKQLRHKKIEC